MKTIISALLFFMSLNLLAQHLSPARQEVFEQTESGIRVKYDFNENEYPKLDIKDIKNPDTLFISIEYPGASVNIIGPYYNYFENHIIWLNVEETFGYIILESEHTFNIIVQFTIYPNKFMIFTENFNLIGTDTLEYLVNQAYYEITASPLDSNGTPFDQLDGVKETDIHFLVPHWLGFYPQNTSIWSEGSLFTSFVSDTIQILTTSIFYDVIEDNVTYFIEYPSISGVDQNINFENNPNDYRNSKIQMYITEENVIQTSLGYTWGIMYKGTRGFFDFFGGGILNFIDNLTYWKGNLYLIKQNNNLFKSTIDLESVSFKQGFIPFTYSYSPFLEVINDSIGAYYYMTPPQNLYKT